MPVSAAGIRVEPPVSDPSPQVTIPAAIAAAVPPDEPPGMRLLSYGFFTGPAKVDKFVLVMPNASSCILALPMTIAPASSSFCSDGAFFFGRAFCNAAVPADVGMSLVLMLSLTTIGRPASAGSFAPESRPASTFCAAVTAASLCRDISEFKSVSRSARSIAACTTLNADACLRAIAATILGSRGGGWAISSHGNTCSDNGRQRCAGDRGTRLLQSGEKIPWSDSS